MEGRTVRLRYTENALHRSFNRSRLGRFARIFSEPDQPGETIMINGTHFKAHQTAASLSKGGTRLPAIGRTKGEPNSKLDMACDGLSRPLISFRSRARGAMRKAP